MFSQQNFKRTSFNNNNNFNYDYYPSQNNNNNSNNDNFSVYSGHSNFTQNSSGTFSNFSNSSGYSTNFNSQINNNNNGMKRKINPLEEINSVMISYIETILPKLIEECSDNIFKKMNWNDLSKQLQEEINNLQNKIEIFEEYLFQQNKKSGSNYYSNKENNKNINKIKVAIDDLECINLELKQQKLIINNNSDTKEGDFNDNNDYVKKLKINLLLLKEDIDQERINSQKLNSELIDRNFKLIEIKNIIDQKLNNLNEYIIHNCNNNNNAKILEEVSDFVYNLEQNLTIAKQKFNKTENQLYVDKSTFCFTSTFSSNINNYNCVSILNNNDLKEEKDYNNINFKINNYRQLKQNNIKDNTNNSNNNNKIKRRNLYNKLNSLENKFTF